MEAQESVVYSGKTIAAAAGAIESIETVLGLTDAARAKAAPDTVLWFEIRATSAFDFGTSAHTASDEQAANDPYFRYGDYNMLKNTYIRAAAGAAITSVVIEIGYSELSDARD